MGGVGRAARRVFFSYGSKNSVPSLRVRVLPPGPVFDSDGRVRARFWRNQTAASALGSEAGRAMGEPTIVEGRGLVPSLAYSIAASQ